MQAILDCIYAQFQLQCAPDARKHRMTIASPCIKLCQLDAAGQYCIGCQRTLDELRRWSKASDDEKQIIIERIKLLESQPS